MYKTKLEETLQKDLATTPYALNKRLYQDDLLLAAEIDDTIDPISNKDMNFLQIGKRQITIPSYRQKSFYQAAINQPLLYARNSDVINKCGIQYNMYGIEGLNQSQKEIEKRIKNGDYDHEELAFFFEPYQSSDTLNPSSLFNHSPGLSYRIFPDGTCYHQWGSVCSSMGITENPDAEYSIDKISGLLVSIVTDLPAFRLINDNL